MLRDLYAHEAGHIRKSYTAHMEPRDPSILLQSKGWAGTLGGHSPAERAAVLGEREDLVPLSPVWQALCCLSFPEKMVCFAGVSPWLERSWGPVAIAHDRLHSLCDPAA